jgi:hypothetical protein
VIVAIGVFDQSQQLLDSEALEQLRSVGELDAVLRDY